MGILERLLETDAEKLSIQEKKDYEVKRISRVIGEPFVVTCHGLTSEQVRHVGEISKNDADMRLQVVLEACTFEGKRFKEEALQKKLGAATGKEVVEKLFKPGEVFALYDIINELSGYGKNAIAEVKNAFGKETQKRG